MVDQQLRDRLIGKVQRLQSDKDTILAYAKGKLVAQDFHAVSDACIDMREIMAEMEFIESLLKIPEDGS